ncbi:type VII secretion EsaA-like protein [Bacillus ectoiniformans]|uniref:type VII secretion protein EsaA n=1 Tax=Bacillus ectoiniformans TaxID=1494429 RepID=UPI00195CFA91|nr:type VII secretion protein EsaA [Bacillus ectoiniformans]MBM7649221.1 type VII secretion EsaA-like protein [Bacillus ectoiniformans]
MNSRKNTWKLPLIIAVILLLPVIFFTLIGENPMKKIKNETGQIAVVNEDVGSAYNKKKIEFGKEMLSRAGEDSDYKWTVVNRSTAENGMADKQYDAVLFIPSDFSSNILTFKKDTPVKADVSYKVQGNLDAKNKEKVQKEMERAKNKMNRQISTLYWGFVSQEVADVREKFDQVLEKEIAFQKSMYKFYTPNSKDLAGEIADQQKMLAELRDTAKSAEGISEDRAADQKKAAEQMALFIENVKQYKDYQEKQSEMLLRINAENSQLLEEGVASYEAAVSQGVQSVVWRETEAPATFTMNPKAFIHQVSAIQTKVDDSRTTISNLVNLLEESTVADQYDRILLAQKNMLMQYKQMSERASLSDLEGKLLPLRQKLQNGAGAEVPSDNNENPPPSDDIPDWEQPEEGELTLEALKSHSANLKEKLAALQTEEQLASFQEVSSVICQLDAEIEKIQSILDAQDSAYSKWQQAASAYANKVQQSQPAPSETDSESLDKAAALIASEEQKILQSDALSSESQRELGALFERPIVSRSLSDLLKYYGTLSAYREVLSHSQKNQEKLIADLLSENGEMKSVGEALSVIKNEAGELETIEQDLTASSGQMDELEAEFHTLADSVQEDLKAYEDQVKEEQNMIMQQVQLIEEDTAKVSAALLEKAAPQPEIESAPALETDDGGLVLSVQRDTLLEVQKISGLVGSLSERHANVTNYTDDLQKKVNSVQTKADELNNNWAKNVEATGLVKKDVYSILGNTFVDGQNNGYVYDHLASPVKVSGSTPAEETLEIPPVIMLVIIVISGLLLGYFFYHYRHLPLSIHLPLVIVLNVLVGIIVSMYGLTIYSLSDQEAIKWSVYTVLLIFTVAGLVRLGYKFGPFTGWIMGLMLILFFIIPLIELTSPNFSMYHPVTEGYMSIQYGDEAAFYPAVIVLLSLSIAAFGLSYWKQDEKSISQETVHEA